MTMRAAPTGFGGGARRAWHLVLPLFCVMLYYLAVVARVARASIVEMLHQDFVLTAKAKGLSRRTILWRHVLPNALIPVVTVIGYNFGYSLTGAILTETVFAWPGLGSLFITSIAIRDYPVLQGIFLFAGAHRRRRQYRDRPALLGDRSAHPPGPARQCVAQLLVRAACLAPTDRRRQRRRRAAAHRLALAAPLVLPVDRNAITSNRAEPPSLEHPLGTDDLGRDVLTGIVYGIQVSLTVGFLAARRGDADRRLHRRRRGLLRRLARPPGHAHLGVLPGDAELHPGRRHRRAAGHRPVADHRRRDACSRGRRRRA